MTISETQSHKPLPSAIFRWGILLFISIAMFGNYYIYDSISPLADLLAKQLNFSDSDIGLLNAIYSVPNLILVLIGGIIIDRLGTRSSFFIFTAICVAGAVVTALSGELFIMATGRLLFGLGAESMLVAINTIIGRWFKGKELSFAFGLNLTVARLGSFAALNSPSWGRAFYDNWQDPLWIAAIAGIVSLIGVIFYWIMDSYAQKNYALRAIPPQDEISIREIFRFNLSFWFVVMLCVTFYSGIFPFQTFAVKFFMHAHGVSRETGGFLSSILTLSAMFLTPLFGLFSDYFGKRSLLMMFGSMLLIPVYLLMAYTDINLYIPMAMMGVSFSLIPAVMWPSVALIVPENKLGTAYGIMAMIQSIGLIIFNLLIGWANDSSGASAENPEGYTLGMWMFSILGFLGVTFSLLLRNSEKSKGSESLEKGLKDTSS